MNSTVTLTERNPGARWLYLVTAVVLVGVFLLQEILSMRAMATTGDEPIYIAAGYSYWKTRDGRMNTEHPPLIKLLLTIPLLPLGLTVPTDDRSWRERNQGAFAARFLYRDLGSVEGLVFRSRLVTVFIAALLAVFVWKWAAELWGAEAGLAALLLFVFEPNILASSRIATLDLGLAAFTFIAMFYVWKWLNTGRARYAMLASATLGFSLLSKPTALAFLAIFLAQFILHHVSASRSGATQHVAPLKGFLQLLAGAMVVGVGLYVVMFQWHPLLRVDGGAHQTVARVLARIPGLPHGAEAQIVALGQHISVPALDNWFEGAVFNKNHLTEGWPSFLMGRHSLYGWWYYYPVAFLIKTPLPILLLMILRLLRLPSIPMRAEEYVLAMPIVGIMLLACFDTVDLGLRYVLPLYPFLFVWLSRIVTLELFGDRGAPTRQIGG